MPASMTSVLDHHMEKPYDEDGIVTAFTGEEGRATAEKPKVNQGCYPQHSPNPRKPFIIKGLYIGTNDGCLADQGLNYDNHPAYDYIAEVGTPVYAAASGKVVKIINKATGLPGRCVPKGIETGGCGIWGYVGIDHGNGYVTQYGHLSRVDVQSGDEIRAGALIGLTGQSSPPKKDKNGNVTKLYSVPPHFHFEVLKENAGSPYGYAFVDPYGWEGEPRNDPLERATSIPNVRLWKTDNQSNLAVPAAVAGGLRAIPFPPELKKYEVNFYEALKIPELGRPVRALVASAPGDRQWVKKFQLVTSATNALIAYSGGNFVILDGCHAHLCPDDQLVIAFDPASRRAWGLIVEDAGTPRVQTVFLGNPPQEIKGLLFAYHKMKYY